MRKHIGGAHWMLAARLCRKSSQTRPSSRGVTTLRAGYRPTERPRLGGRGDTAAKSVRSRARRRQRATPFSSRAERRRTTRGRAGYRQQLWRKLWWPVPVPMVPKHPLSTGQPLGWFLLLVVVLQVQLQLQSQPQPQLRLQLRLQFQLQFQAAPSAQLHRSRAQFLV